MGNKIDLGPDVIVKYHGHARDILLRADMCVGLNGPGKKTWDVSLRRRL